MACELFLHILVVVSLLYAVSTAVSMIPFPGITTTPDTASINSVGISLQSVKYILFEDELSQLYAPSPPSSSGL